MIQQQNNDKQQGLKHEGDAQQQISNSALVTTSNGKIREEQDDKRQFLADKRGQIVEDLQDYLTEVAEKKKLADIQKLGKF